MNITNILTNILSNGNLRNYLFTVVEKVVSIEGGKLKFREWAGHRNIFMLSSEATCDCLVVKTRGFIQMVGYMCHI